MGSSSKGRNGRIHSGKAWNKVKRKTGTRTELHRWSGITGGAFGKSKRPLLDGPFMTPRRIRELERS